MTTVLDNLTVKGLIARRTVPGQGRAMETIITRSGTDTLVHLESQVRGLLASKPMRSAELPCLRQRRAINTSQR
jgi:hypothetical protein